MFCSQNTLDVHRTSEAILFAETGLEDIVTNDEEEFEFRSKWARSISILSGVKTRTEGLTGILCLVSAEI